MKKLTRSAIITDIHFGRKANCIEHNQDCINFLQWFCNIVRSNQIIDNIFFLGDWHETRNAINISTLKYSYTGAKLLNSLNIPVYFIVGNHDLYNRHSREIHSVEMWKEFSNITIIDQPVILNNVGNTVLACPFLLANEYNILAEYKNIKTWFGHFEFKDFIVTGHTIKLPYGPSHKDFKEQDFIFSGHFHKRQITDNTVYVGNTFPMDFSDAGDFNRGCMIYDHDTRKVIFHDWEFCPKYMKTTLSKILKRKMTIPKNTTLQCIVDIPLSFEESHIVSQQLIDKYNLRQLHLQEDSDQMDDTLMDTMTDADKTKGTNISDLIIQMLKDINTEHIDNSLLIEIYHSLRL